MALTNLVKGDDWKFTGTVLQPSGTPQDITGGTAWVTLKSNVADVDTAAVFQVKMATIPASDANGTDAVNGIVVLVAAWDDIATGPPDSTLVAVGNYAYDFQYLHTDGSISTVEIGTVTVVAQVTEATS
jgi:hypothetical protein